MYPEGIKAMEEAVELVAADNAPKIAQPKEGASYDAFLNKVCYQVMPGLIYRIFEIVIYGFARI